MKLEPTLQVTLLELATAERAASITRERGAQPAATPEQFELERLEKDLERAKSAAGSAQLAVADMELEILRIQEDERKYAQRERDDRAQLTAVTDSEKRKDLERDKYTAKSRRADLLSELKEAHNEIAALRNNRDVHGAKVSDLERKVEVAKRAAEAANDAPKPEDPSDRIEELKAALPAEVLAEYERQRAENAVGVAKFNGRSCGGCFVVLPAAERAEIAHARADELPQCPECGSYLVRVAKAAQ